MSRQASNCCERVLEAAKLVSVNKRKESVTSQKLGSHDFWRIANNVLNHLLRNNLLRLLYSMAKMCYLLRLIKQNCLLKTFPKILNFVTEVSLTCFPF